MSDTATSEQSKVTQLPATRPRDIRVVTDDEPILDTGKFEHMQRIAHIMARCALIPVGLKSEKNFDTTVANCFLVVNQAVRWGMDPFAVAQCASVIHGKLCYEGKLVAAVMQKHGINLSYEFNGKSGDELAVTVRGTLPGEERPREVRGTVGGWKTSNDQWKKDPQAMLCYRGARAWSRIHNPAPMLGVYTPEEMEDAPPIRDVTPAKPPRERDAGPPMLAERMEVDVSEMRDVTLTSKPAPVAPDPDVALVESGLDDGRQETWGEPEGDGIPDGLRRQSPLGIIVADIKGLEDMHACFEFGKTFEARLERLTPADRKQARQAYIDRQIELNKDSSNA